MKKLFVFVESNGVVTKHEVDTATFDGSMGNFIAKLSHDYPIDAIYYVGGLA